MWPEINKVTWTQSNKDADEKGKRHACILTYSCVSKRDIQLLYRKMDMGKVQEHNGILSINLNCNYIYVLNQIKEKKVASTEWIPLRVISMSEPHLFLTFKLKKKSLLKNNLESRSNYSLVLVLLTVSHGFHQHRVLKKGAFLEALL